MVPYHDRPNPALLMPHLSLFPEELKYWRDAHDQAVKDSDPIIQAVAVRLREEMRGASRNAVNIHMAAGDGIRRVKGTGVAEWYNRTTKYLAWSRMWRGMMADMVAADALSLSPNWVPGTDAALPEILVEQGSAEPNCGIQIVPGKFLRLFGVDAPEEPSAWLENSDVFVQTTRPAVPGINLDAQYREQNAVFPAEEYITARPFLKSEVWQSYVDLS